MSKIEITISEGRVVDIISDKDVDITVFRYDKVKKGTFKKKVNDLLAIEIHNVKGDKNAVIGVSNEI